MGENLPADASAVSQRPRRIVPEGRRFERGASGCPGGRAGKIRRLRAEHTTQLEAHLGRPLQPQEVEFVEQLIIVKMTKPSSAAETLRQAGLIARLTERLYGDAKVEAPRTTPVKRRSVDEVLAAMAVRNG